VASDNSSDNTDDLGITHGAQVVVTVENTTRKAGALNQALRYVLPQLRDRDYVLIMDADSRLKGDWIAHAVRAMRDDRRLGGVCGTYEGEEGSGLLRQLQRNEYARGARLVRRRAELWVLSGAGTLFRVSALRAIASERGFYLPGTPGDYYSGESITEDYEITLALKTLGYRCLAAPGCIAVTELMPTVRDLSRQRIRWQTGTLATLRRYGLTRITWTNWLRQVFFYGVYLVGMASWGLIAWLFALHPGIDLPRWVLGALIVTYLERLITVRKAGWKGIILAALLVPEWCYGMLEGFYLFKALVHDIARRDVSWGHLAANRTGFAAQSGG